MSDPFFQMMAADDPSPVMHALRASDPVHRVEPMGFWLVTRHDDVKRLYHDPEYVTHDKRDWNDYVTPPEGSMRRWAEDYGIFAVGPEEHARLRRLVAKAFTPRAVRRMEAQLREVIGQIAEPLRGREGEVIDLMAELTNQVPNAVISRITGVPPGDDQERFCEIAQSVIQGSRPFAPDDVLAEAERGFGELAAWVREMVVKRREYPEEDLVTDLVHAEDADETLSEDDVVLLLASLIGAGSEATAMVAASIVATLLDEPAALGRLRADRSLVRSGIDEIVRYAFRQPSGTLRFALCDFELRGKRIRKGEMLMLSICGGSFDPDVYPDPDVFDLDRDVREALYFGNGPHFCLGANLAREELATLLDVILDVVPPGSGVCQEALEYLDMGLFRRATNLPVRIGPATSD